MMLGCSLREVLTRVGRRECCMGSLRFLRLNCHCNGGTGDAGNLIG